MRKQRGSPARGERAETGRPRQQRPEPLELAFYQLLLRLSQAERQHLAEELAQPFRRQWLIVDEHGLRRLEE